MNYPYGREVLLTGGSSGIGLACSELLAKNGYIVYSASRNPKSEVITFGGGGEIRPVKMDVSNAASVGEACSEILSRASIGIIIHSAGIGIACPAEDFPPGAVSDLMATNFMGILHLNSLILPHFRRRGSGLCIMVSSVASIFPIPFQSHYCASKSALEAYAGALRMELSDFNIKVALVLPGDTNTGFTNARSYALPENSPHYASCIKSVAKMEKDELSGRPPSSVAEVIYKLIGKKNPPLRSVVGFDYKVLAFAKRLLPERLVEFLLKKMYM